MTRLAELVIAVAAVALAALGVHLFARRLGAGAGEEAVLLATAAVFAAVAAHLAAGIAQRPILALSVPLLVGWWIATLGPVDLVTTLLFAGAGGALAGGLCGLVAGGAPWRAGAITLLLALAAERVSDLFADDRLAASPAPVGAEMLTAMALGALALGWWAQAGLTAALLDAGRRPEAAASLGFRTAPWLAAAGAWGGIAGGWAGAVMAHAGAAAPSVTTGLILAAAALVAGGTMAATAALTIVFWFLPQLALRAGPDVPDLAPWLAAGGVAAVLAAAAFPAREADEDG
jgi:hypothetical protein